MMRLQRLRTFVCAAACLAALTAARSGAVGGEPGSPEVVTKVGAYDDLYTGRLAVTVHPAKAGRHAVAITFRFSGRGGETLVTDTFEPSDGVRQGAQWFVYPETEERVWLFDGQGELLLAQCTFAVTRKRKRGETIRATSDVRTSDTDAGLVGKAPKAVRDRLPQAFLDRFMDKH